MVTIKFRTLESIAIVILILIMLGGKDVIGYRIPMCQEETSIRCWIQKFVEGKRIPMRGGDEVYYIVDKNKFIIAITHRTNLVLHRDHDYIEVILEVGKAPIMRRISNAVAPEYPLICSYKESKKLRPLQMLLVCGQKIVTPKGTLACDHHKMILSTDGENLESIIKMGVPVFRQV